MAYAAPRSTSLALLIGYLYRKKHFLRVQMPAFAVGSAVSSMAAQNVGAGRWDGVARIARDGVVYNVRLTAAPTARIAPAAVVTSPEQS